MILLMSEKIDVFQGWKHHLWQIHLIISIILHAHSIAQHRLVLLFRNRRIAFPLLISFQPLLRKSSSYIAILRKTVL